MTRSPTLNLVRRPEFSDIDLAVHRLDDEDVAAWSCLLAPQERARADRFRQVDDRRRCMIGRGLLRSMLGRRLDRAPHSLTFEVDRQGKPTLSAAQDLAFDDIAFNVSHSGDYVLAAVGRAAAIGVDVERHRADLDLVGVARQVFTASECASLDQAPADQKISRFFRQWTCKEAVAKAVGLGLARGLNDFEIVFTHDLPKLVSHGATLGSPSNWRLTALSITPDYAAALAVRRSEGLAGAAQRL